MAEMFGGGGGKEGRKKISELQPECMMRADQGRVSVRERLDLTAFPFKVQSVRSFFRMATQ